MPPRRIVTHNKYGGLGSWWQWTKCLRHISQQDSTELSSSDHYKRPARWQSLRNRKLRPMAWRKSCWWSTLGCETEGANKRQIRCNQRSSSQSYGNSGAKPLLMGFPCPFSWHFNFQDLEILVYWSSNYHVISLCALTSFAQYLSICHSSCDYSYSFSVL